MHRFLKAPLRLFINLIFISLTAYCSNLSDIKRVDPNYGVTWMFFPDGDGNPQIIDIAESDSQARGSIAHEDPDSKIKMWLYNQQFTETPKPLKTTGWNNRDNFTLDENFDSNKITKIIIHGWRNNLTSNVIQMIKNAYLATPEDMNIVAVDWGEMAGDINYLRSAASTQNVGRNVAAVIDHMVTERNAQLEDIHVIGHSLGAHTAGFSGMYLKSGGGEEKVGRITGLDPAYPGFLDESKTYRTLDPNDGEFVDVIHTCAGVLGHKANLGHADFFPNSGKPSQPGCDFPSDFIGSCSHSSSYIYFTESIQVNNRFMALECDNWDDYKSKKCEGDPVPMGEQTPSSARGTFYLETTSA